ncbi:MAG: Fur family transcriptional regulator [Phycisphaerae bacterium]|jgi:Fur family peroxide stress response transcriptional regulator
MAILSSQQIDSHLACFAETLRRLGLKVTHQRMEIYKEVASNSHHPDAETVYKAVKSRVPAVSLDTVYRTLCLLEKEDILHRIETSSDRARFDADTSQHYHFICNNCSRIIDFQSTELNEIQLPQSLEVLGEVRSYHVLARGICAKCTGTTAHAEA